MNVNYLGAVAWFVNIDSIATKVAAKTPIKEQITKYSKPKVKIAVAVRPV